VRGGLQRWASKRTPTSRRPPWPRSPRAPSWIDDRASVILGSYRSAIRRPVRQRLDMRRITPRTLRCHVAVFLGGAVFVVATGALATSGNDVPAAAEPARECTIGKGRRVAETPEVVVVGFPSKGSLDPRYDRKARFYACFKQTGVRRRLDRGLKTRFRVFPPVGRFVVSVAYDTIAGYIAAHLTDVGSGARYALLSGPWENANGDVATVLLKRNGSLAFLTVTDPDTLYRCEFPACYSTSRRARLTKLDEGTISERSLRLSGSTISWQDEVGRRTASLR